MGKKQSKRVFRKPAELLIQQARIVHSLLYGTNGIDGDLALFTLDFPTMDAIWLAGFLAKINDADDAPSDEEVKTDQRLATQAVNKQMHTARLQMLRLFRYAQLAFPENKKARELMGYALYLANRYSQTGMQQSMEVTYEKANAEPYRTALIAAGFSALQITDIKTTAQTLNDLNLEQETKKISRLEMTAGRTKKLNDIWAIIKNLDIASKITFEENKAKQRQYRKNSEKSKAEKTKNQVTPP